MKKIALVFALALVGVMSVSAQGTKVLLFSEVYGYNHRQGREAGDAKLAEEIAKRPGWSLVKERNPKKLGDEKFLAGFDAIVFNNSTGLGEKQAPGLTKALQSYLASGKGVCLIHSALDAFNREPELSKAFGGLFTGHPWHAHGKWRFKLENATSPLNAPLAKYTQGFTKSDEIYMFGKHYDRKGTKVLISLDIADKATAAAEKKWGANPKLAPLRKDRDYAVAWTRDIGKGRVFYSSFGHDARAFNDRELMAHFLAGLDYCVGTQK